MGLTSKAPHRFPTDWKGRSGWNLLTLPPPPPPPPASVAGDAPTKATAMDQEEGSTTVDNIVTQFNTYEDFLDSQITTLDMYYLEVRAAAPQGGPQFRVPRSLPSPRVVGCSPPGGGPRERQAPQFPDCCTAGPGSVQNSGPWRP